MKKSDQEEFLTLYNKFENLKSLPPSKMEFQNRVKGYVYSTEQNKDKAEKTEFGVTYGLVSEHPLNNASKSDWSRYFNDQDLWTEIEKDVRRTRTDLNYFCKAYDPA